MLGINTIVLNQASMNRAMEHYLRTVLLKNGLVGVCSVIKNNGQYEIRFEIAKEPS